MGYSIGYPFYSIQEKYSSCDILNNNSHIFKGQIWLICVNNCYLMQRNPDPIGHVGQYM